MNSCPIRRECLRIALGFNFPCPVRPLGPASGIVTNWTKSYNVGNVLGKDVAKLLQDALDKNGLSHIRVSVLLNDTMATLLAGSYGPSTQSVLVGVMLGTATNCVYQQRIDQIDMISEHHSAMDFLRSARNPNKTMIVDTEWGAFGESSGDLDSLRTTIDEMVDEASGNPGRDSLTKLVCGMYTGEIVRLILAKLHAMNYVLPNRDVPFLGITGRWKMDHFHMSSVETDRGITFSATKKVLADLGMEADMDTCRIVKKVCEAVTCRSASIAGAVLAAVIRRIPRELVTVAIDGSLLRFHPTYRKRLEDSIDKMLKMRPSKLVARQSFVLKLITDGAIVGAGIAAACHQRDLNGNRTANKTENKTASASALSNGANEKEVMIQKKFNGIPTQTPAAFSEVQKNEDLDRRGTVIPKKATEPNLI